MVDELKESITDKPADVPGADDSGKENENEETLREETDE